MYVNVPWTNTTYSVGDGGLTQRNFTTALRDKLNGIADSANNYSLPLAANGTRGGVQVGYTENGKNYPVELDSEKMYVNVPWTNTTYSVGDGGLTQRNFTTALRDKLNGIADTADNYSSWSFDTSSNGTNESVTSGDVVRFEAGTGMTVDHSGDTITFTCDITDTNTFRTVEVDTDGNGSANNTLTATETLRFKKGTNIGLSESGGIITISSTDTNTTYSLKAQQTGGNNTNPNILLDANTGTDDTIQLVGSGATTVTRNSDGQITISSTDNNDDTIYTHPSYTARSEDETTTGAEVFKDIEISSDNIGSITALNVTKRTLTLADLGYNGDTDAEENQFAYKTVATQNGNAVADNKEDTLTINGADGISTSSSGDTITITGTVPNVYKTVRAENSSGTELFTHTASGISDQLRLRQGSNITFSNAGTDIITITATNTTYSASTGLDLSGSNAFSLEPDLRNEVDYIGGSGSTADYIDMSAAAQFKVVFDNQEDFRFSDGGTFHTRGDIIAFSSTITSDENLKDNIQKVDGALELVSQLDGVTFNWKKDGSPSAGVIAQNVEKVLPSAVKEVESLDGENHKHVDYNQLSALFIEAIKELKEENKLLRDEIENLKVINKGIE